jgi:hypothetical protein
MRITLEIPPDIEAAARDRATSGDAADVQRLLEQAVAPAIQAAVETLLSSKAPENERRADGVTDAEFEALADQLAAMTPGLPVLSEEAMSRAGIYGDHP